MPAAALRPCVPRSTPVALVACSTPSGRRPMDRMTTRKGNAVCSLSSPLDPEATAVAARCSSFLQVSALTSPLADLLAAPRTPQRARRRPQGLACRRLSRAGPGPGRVCATREPPDMRVPGRRRLEGAATATKVRRRLNPSPNLSSLLVSSPNSCDRRKQGDPCSRRRGRRSPPHPAAFGLSDVFGNGGSPSGGVD